MVHRVASYVLLGEKCASDFSATSSWKYFSIDRELRQSNIISNFCFIYAVMFLFKQFTPVVFDINL